MPSSVVQTSGTPVGVEHPPSPRTREGPSSTDLSRIAQDLSVRKALVESVTQMLEEGCTIPFMLRHRRERSGGLSEEMLRLIQDRLHQWRQLGDRKKTILRTIENQGKLTAELRAAIQSADHPRRLEDLYLPYKPKKRTPASAARDKGLEPLALAVWHADPAVNNLAEVLPTMLNPEKELTTPEQIVEGVRHLLAQWIGESIDVRAALRHVLWESGKLLVSKNEKLTEGQAQEHKDYFQFSGPIRHLPPYRILAINRGEKENALTGKLEWDTEAGLRVALERLPLPLAGSPLPEPPPIAPSQAAQLIPSEPQPTPSEPSAIPSEPPPLGSGELSEAPPLPPVETPRPAPPSVRLTPMAQRAEAVQNHPHADLLRQATADALTHILTPSLEREVRRELTYRAEDHAIATFARNLRSRLLAAPLPGRRVLAIDPAFRTGCKLAVLDESGNLLDHSLIHPHDGGARAEARGKLEELVRKHQVHVIAIGNGAACRETEELVSEVIAELDARRRGEASPAPPPAVSEPPLSESVSATEPPANPPPAGEPSAAATEPPAPPPPPSEPLPDALPELAYVIVSEAGAGAYASSPIGREELPQSDAPLRASISIGRRLQDPLRELVKIDPQHVCVGLYQHDVNHKQLRQILDGVVESCVNQVGVDANTANVQLLRRISGFNPLLARDWVEHRKAHGPFRNRQQFLQVNGMTELRFRQSAGFLKIIDGDNPLDATWIHPESYHLAEEILKDLGFASEVLRDPQRGAELREKLKTVPVESTAARLQTDVPTLRHILAELAHPGRDCRDEQPPPVLKKTMLKIEHLQPGMELKGTVLNVVDFGAFVDIGLKDSGLVHISQMANRYVKCTYDVVSIGDVMPVWVLSVDRERQRVSLSMVAPGTIRRPPERKREPRPRPPAPADRRESPPGSRPPRRGRRPQPPRGGPSPSPVGQGDAAGPAATSGIRSPAPPPRSPQPPPRKPRRHPPKPKLTQAALAGATPLGTFAELAAFWEAKKKEEPQPVPPAPPAEGGELPPG